LEEKELIEIIKAFLLEHSNDYESAWLTLERILEESLKQVHDELKEKGDNK